MLMVLACSLQTDRNLPIDAVAELLDGLDDPPLRAAIEKYLRADDGEKARTLLLAMYPREPSALERYHSDNPPEEVFGLSDRSWDGGRDIRIMVRRVRAIAVEVEVVDGDGVVVAGPRLDEDDRVVLVARHIAVRPQRGSIAIELEVLLVRAKALKGAWLSAPIATALQAAFALALAFAVNLEPWSWPSPHRVS